MGGASKGRAPVGRVLSEGGAGAGTWVRSRSPAPSHFRVPRRQSRRRRPRDPASGPWTSTLRAGTRAVPPGRRARPDQSGADLPVHAHRGEPRHETDPGPPGPLAPGPASGGECELGPGAGSELTPGRSGLSPSSLSGGLLPPLLSPVPGSETEKLSHEQPKSRRARRPAGASVPWLV